jgi:MerR family transcriptional regulator, copper efflux regulator
MVSPMEARTNTPQNQPLACSLESEALEERGNRWRALVARALVEQHDTATGVRQRYRPEPDVEHELRELARAERDCCGFASWEVRAGEGFVELEVSSTPDGAAVVQEMFRA